MRKFLSIALIDIYYCDKDGEAATNMLCVVTRKNANSIHQLKQTQVQKLKVVGFAYTQTNWKKKNVVQI